MAIETIGEAQIVITSDTSSFIGDLTTKLTAPMRSSSSSLGQTFLSSFKSSFNAARAGRDIDEGVASGITANKAKVNAAAKNLFAGAENEARESGKRAGGSFTAALSGIAGLVASRSIFAQAKEVSNLTTQLERLFDTKEAANEFTTNLNALADRTTLSFTQAGRAAVQFKQVGLDAAQSLALIETANASVGGDPERFQSVSRALSQIQGRGKLAGQEIVQLNEAGVNTRAVLDQMAKQLGVTSEQLNKMKEKGLIPASTFMAAFIETNKDLVKATAENQNGFQKLDTALSTLKSKSILLVTEALNPLVATAAKLVDKIIPLATKFSEMVAASDSLKKALTGVAAGFGGLSGILALTPVFSAVSGLFAAISLPMIAVVVAIGALVVAWNNLSNAAKADWIQKAKDAFESLKVAVVDFVTQAIPVLVGAWDAVRPGLEAFGAVALQVASEIIPALVDIFGKFIAGIRPHIKPVFEKIGEIFKASSVALKAMWEAIKPLVPLIGKMAEVIGKVIGWAFDKMLGQILFVLQKLPAVIRTVVTGIEKMISALRAAKRLVDSVFGGSDLNDKLKDFENGLASRGAATRLKGMVADAQKLGSALSASGVSLDASLNAGLGKARGVLSGLGKTKFAPDPSAGQLFDPGKAPAAVVDLKKIGAEIAKIQEEITALIKSRSSKLAAAFSDGFAGSDGLAKLRRNYEAAKESAIDFFKNQQGLIDTSIAAFDKLFLKQAKATDAKISFGRAQIEIQKLAGGAINLTTEEGINNTEKVARLGDTLAAQVKEDIRLGATRAQAQANLAKNTARFTDLLTKQGFKLDEVNGVFQDIGLFNGDAFDELSKVQDGFKNLSDPTNEYSRLALDKLEPVKTAIGALGANMLASGKSFKEVTALFGTESAALVKSFGLQDEATAKSFAKVQNTFVIAADAGILAAQNANTAITKELDALSAKLDEVRSKAASPINITANVDLVRTTNPQSGIAANGAVTSVEAGGAAPRAVTAAASAGDSVRGAASAITNNWFVGGNAAAKRQAVGYGPV